MPLVTGRRQLAQCLCCYAYCCSLFCWQARASKPAAKKPAKKASSSKRSKKSKKGSDDDLHGSDDGESDNSDVSGSDGDEDRPSKKKRKTAPPPKASGPKKYGRRVEQLRNICKQATITWVIIHIHLYRISASQYTTPHGACFCQQHICRTPSTLITAAVVYSCYVLD